MEQNKELYYMLQNLDENPGCVTQARRKLLSLLSTTLGQSLEAQPSPSHIFSIPTFTPQALREFFKATYSSTMEQWTQYVSKRKAGGPREVFHELDHAKWWLRTVAPVKYVDGAWVQHVHKPSHYSSAQRFERDATKILWQILSEELGDGDLRKNHVTCYENLMDEIGADLPRGHQHELTSPQQRLSEATVWEAAVSQLVMSLFPDEFLPEIIGFNMSYEQLPLHLLKTVHELKELKLNPYYFQLHISIDNADTGHAAMGRELAIKYLLHIKSTLGEEEMQRHWRRVQAGFNLADTIPTTPSFNPRDSKSDDKAARRKRLMKVLVSKCQAAHQVHSSTAAKIGGRSLVSWMDPTTFAEEADDFLVALADNKVYVKKGDPEGSRLVKLFSWGGKMFGAMTHEELDILKEWVTDLGQSDPSEIAQPGSTYFQFVYGEEAVAKKEEIYSFDQGLLLNSLDPNSLTQKELDWKSWFEPITTHPSHPRPPVSSATLQSLMPLPKQVPNTLAELLADSSSLTKKSISFTQVQVLWFVHAALLENVPCLPSKVATQIGMDLTRVMRLWYGFTENGGDLQNGTDDEICKGMSREEDQLGLWDLGELLSTTAKSNTRPSSLSNFSTLPSHQLKLPTLILLISSQPYHHLSVILGLCLGFSVLLHSNETIRAALPTTWGTNDSARLRLQHIATTGTGIISKAIKQFSSEDPDKWRDVVRGFNCVRDTIGGEVLPGAACS